MATKIDRLTTILILALLLSTPLNAGGAREKQDNTFTGRVAVKGSEPHTQIVLVTIEADYVLTGPLAERIRNEYQGHTLEVSGEIRKEALGPGFPAELEVFEIVKVH